MTTTTQSRSLSTNDRNILIQATFEAKHCAYNPYSKFRVGAALLSPDGVLIKGASIDNASYSETICAERTAIVKAVSDGIRSFIGLAVTSDKAFPISPCGICRQVVREFRAPEMPILLIPANYYDNGRISEGAEIQETTLGELLPNSFGPENLGLATRSRSIAPAAAVALEL